MKDEKKVAKLICCELKNKEIEGAIYLFSKEL